MKKLIHYGISLIVMSILMFGSIGAVSAHEVVAVTGSADSSSSTQTDNGRSIIKIKSINGVEVNTDRSSKDKNASATDSVRGKTDDKVTDGTDKDRTMFFQNFSFRFEHITGILTAFSDRLTKLADRIESRIKKETAEKVDTAESASFVAKARADIKIAQTRIADAEAAFKAEMAAAASTEITHENYKQVFTKTLTHLKATREALKSAHRDLVQAITHLKDKMETKAKVKTEVKSDVEVKVSN